MNSFKQAGNKATIFISLLSFLILFQLAAYGDNFSTKAGCVIAPMGLLPVGTVKDNSANNFRDLPVGCKIDFISVGANSRIDGPDANGSITGDDKLIQTYDAGNDSVGNNFTNIPGKFWHSISGGLAGGVTNNFYVRVWNNSNKADPVAYFEESTFFTAVTAAVGNPVPNNNPLSDFSTVFPKAAPTGPIAAPTAVVNFNAVSNRFDANITWKSAFGARQYIVNQVDDMNGANSRPITPADTIWNADGRCSPNSIDPKSWTWPNLEELKKYYVRIEAKNTFGSALSEVLEINTPEYPDPNPPGAIFDLRAEVVKDTPPFSVKLSWTAPSDKNKAGNIVKVSGYEIKASNEGPLKSIIYAPNSKPDPIDTYETAKTVNVLNYTIDPNIDPAGDPNNPNANVKGIDEVQETTISSIPNRGLYFFAVKSIDAPVGAISNKSALSNLAAVQLGAGSAASFTLYPTDTQKLVVNTVFLSSAPVTDAAGLAAHINTFKGAKVVNAIAEWDLLGGSARSALFDANGALVSGSDNFNVYPGRCYQIYTSQQVDNLNL